MNRNDIIRMAREAGFICLFPDEAVNGIGTIYNYNSGHEEITEMMERFAALVAVEVHKTYNPIGTVAGGATERTFMHPSVKFILPTGLQLYARIEVREEDKA